MVRYGFMRLRRNVWPYLRAYRAGKGTDGDSINPRQSERRKRGATWSIDSLGHMAQAKDQRFSSMTILFPILKSAGLRGLFAIRSVIKKPSDWPLYGLPRLI